MTVIAETTPRSPAFVTAKIVLESNFLSSPNLEAAQTFQVDEGAWDITSVELYLARDNDGGDDAGTITVQLREDSPTGTILGTQTMSRLDLSTVAFVWEVFTFSGFTLSSGNTYCVTIACPYGHHNAGLDYDTVYWPYASSYALGVGYNYSDPAGWVIQVYDWSIKVNGTELQPPEKAITPAPGHGVSTVKLSLASTTWVDGGAGESNAAESYDVYYGTSSGNLSLTSSAQAPLSFTVTGITNGSPYSYLTTRYWRIDSTNEAGTTTGDEWSFTTIRLRPPTSTRWYSGGGYYYRPLIQADGTYGDPPPGGVEDTDYEVLAGYLPNFVSTARKLVGVANSKVWVEDL